VTWVEDVNSDNQIVAEDGDHVYLYVGMRRGGRNYYALDVTDRANPVLMWTIIGGQPGDDYEQLGQTWSAPVRTKVNIASTVEEVLVFAGGYHPGQDDAAVKTADAYGNAVFIVRAGPDSNENGGNEDGTPDVIWSAGDGPSFDLDLPAMDYSMPASPKVLDMDHDGYPDQLYIGDVGGQLWRFDFSNSAVSAATYATAGIIGSISGIASNDARRFYHTPDVSLVNQSGYTFLNIAMGSGFHAHPLNEVIDDRFYSFRSSDVFAPPASYVAKTESDIYDATANLLGTEGDSLTEEDLAAEIAQFTAASGWLMDLERSGEKVLANSLTVNNQVIFTTYEPNNTSGSGCTAAIGTSRVYVVSVVDGVPLLDVDEDGDKDKTDRSLTLSTSSIAPEPFALVPETGDPIILVGPETPVEDLDFGNLSVRTYWYQKMDPAD
jgi:type IV pilus assembly protein PilY1|tara:strand:+ start:10643 stop:11950 length:1308 start_codon:yes stop_codon:yes gene_type:complete